VPNQGACRGAAGSGRVRPAFADCEPILSMSTARFFFFWFYGFFLPLAERVERRA
jgi:hypothetical protein